MLFITHEQELTWIRPKQILHFYSVSDPFCQKNILVLDRIESQFPDTAFFAIDVDYFANLLKRFEIITFPTTIFFENGEERYRLINIDHNFLSYHQ
jgi:hypothetical protein